MKVAHAIPAIGTPEFRAFVQTPEWMAMRHEQALEDDKVWEETQRREAVGAYIGSVMPTIIIDNGYGRTDPKTWCRDWREKLPIDHPDRMDYEESIYGKSETDLFAEDVRNLGMLHELALTVTVPS